MSTHHDDHDKPQEGQTPAPKPQPPQDPVTEGAVLPETPAPAAAGGPPTPAKPPKHTMIAGRMSTPTMLDPTPPELPAGELAGTAGVVSPPPASAEPVVTAVPNLSIDEPEIEFPVVEAIPVEGHASDVIVAEPVEAHGSEVVMMAEPVSGKPESDLVEVLPVEDVLTGKGAKPASEVLAAEPVSPADPGSDVIEAQPVSGVAHDSGLVMAEAVSGEPGTDGPGSDVLEATHTPDILTPTEIHSGIYTGSGIYRELVPEPDDVVEAMPASEIVAAEEVLGGEIAEAQPLSEPKSAKPTESDVVAAEEVLGDEVVGHGSAGSPRPDSAVAAVPFDEDEAVDLGAPAEAGESPAMVGKKAVGSDTVPVPDSGAVNWDEIGEVTETTEHEVDLGKTVAYEPGKAPPSDDSLVTEADLAAAVDEESSAVDLGKSPSKAKQRSGVDEVAEAIESGVNLDDDVPVKKGTPSVEFDDLLTEEAVEAVEEPAPRKKGRKESATGDDIDLGALDEGGTIEDEIVPPSRAKKKKKKPTSDALDDEALAALLGDDTEAADAVAAEDEDEAEAVAVPADDEEGGVSFDDDEAVATAVEDEDEAFASAVADDDEAVAVAVADEDEDEERPRKKKRRTALADEDEMDTGSRSRRAPAAPPRRSILVSMFIWVFLMGLGAVAAAGLIAGGVFLAPTETRDALKMVNADFSPEPKKQGGPVKLNDAQQAHDLIDKGEYQEAIDLLKDTPKEDAAALSARAEARWLKYVKDKKGAVDAADPEVKEVRDDLNAAKNDDRLKQIDLALSAGTSGAALQGVQAALQNNKVEFADPKELPKAINETLAAKKKSENELKILQGALIDEKLIEPGKTPDLATLKKSLQALSSSKIDLADINKMLAELGFKDAGTKGVEGLASAKKDADAKLANVDKVLKGEKIKATGVQGVVELVKNRDAVQKDRDDIAGTLKAAFDELTQGKVADADPRKQIVEAARIARLKGQSPLAGPVTDLGSSLSGMGTGVARLVERGFDNAQLLATLGYYKTQEQFVQQPTERLDTYLSLLHDRTRKDARELVEVRNLADHVRSDKGTATPEAKAKALYAVALAQRNEEKFDDARKTLQEVVAESKAAKLKAPWLTQANKDLKELTDPQAYYLPRVETLREAGNTKGALAEINAALKALPDNGWLRARRALINLEAARGKGKAIPAPVQKAVRADAEAARKDKASAAEGAYVLGLLEEETGNFDGAESLYREAIKVHQGKEDDASRYRVALARLLLRDRPAAQQAPPPAEEKGKDKAGEPTSSLPAPAMHPFTQFVVAASIGYFPEEGDEPAEEAEDPKEVKRIEESLSEVKKLIGSANPTVKKDGYDVLGKAVERAAVKLSPARNLDIAKGLIDNEWKDARVTGYGYLLRGQALSRSGKRTEGLMDYAKGLQTIRPDLSESKEIAKLLDVHPAFQQPDISKEPNPSFAEQHFGQGLHFYWSRQYAEAEAQFKQAVRYYDQDARYYYFLGLAQRAQKKKDPADYSFRKGARLEAQSQPSITQINASLERVQGDLRQMLNGYRYKLEEKAAQ